MTFWEFLDSLPWWVMFLAGVFAGSVAMYGPARAHGWLDHAAGKPR